MRRDALLKVARPFRRPRSKAIWTPTGGGDVADSPTHVDLLAFRIARLPRSQHEAIRAQAETRSALIAEGVRSG